MSAEETTENYQQSSSNAMIDPQKSPVMGHPPRQLSSTPTTYGRVVYLHFACRAPLPIGSYLRVTSSQLWAPGTLTPSDPTDAKTISVKANELALPDNTFDGMVDAADGEGLGSNVQISYASSVEMVTSPGKFFFIFILYCLSHS
jgi:hypothetical protein